MLFIEDFVAPYIVMSKYAENLKKYRKEKNEITDKDFMCLVKFFFAVLSSIHKKSIIHRDIKPENILVDADGNFVLTDFGIAHFNEEYFPIDNKTKKGERLANIEFSAPEQISNQGEITQTADIYSMAQVMYWFIFGFTNRGTGAEYISQRYDWDDAYIFDNIIMRCLRNDPKERFQSIEEIEEYYNVEKSKTKDLDPFEDMYRFHDAVVSVVPEFYGQAFSITDKKIMSQLFERIFSENYNNPIQFNTGIRNNCISSIKRIENDDFLMDGRQLNILSIWGLLTSDIYNDILLLEIGKSALYKIEGKEYNAVAVIEKEDIVPYYEIESGYIRYKGTVYKIKDLNIEERFVGNDCKVIALAPFHSCVIIKENDTFLLRLQNKDKVQQSDICKLKEQVSRNIADDVSMYL